MGMGIGLPGIGGHTSEGSEDEEEEKSIAQGETKDSGATASSAITSASGAGLGRKRKTMEKSDQRMDSAVDAAVATDSLEGEEEEGEGDEVDSKDIRSLLDEDEEEEEEEEVKPEPKRRRTLYSDGMHGAKKREQQRLSREHGIKVSGKSHESEHAIGYEVLSRGLDAKRGKSQEARRLENLAPAYQEVKSLHREHIGTGTRGSPDDSGFTSQSYRDSQRSLIQDGDISSAVQLNQLGYAFDPETKTELQTLEGQAATDSYNTMVENMASVGHTDGSDVKAVGVDARQRAEMYLSRQTILSGAFPTVDEENAARQMFGLPDLSDDDCADERD
jgi:hypothetical protein